MVEQVLYQVPGWLERGEVKNFIRLLYCDVAMYMDDVPCTKVHECVVYSVQYELVPR